MAARALRIAMLSSDPLRANALAAALTAAGHALVADAMDCDVVVLDHAALSDAVDASRTVAIGDPLPGAAAQLAADATLEQIEAAIRAVAAGLIVRSPGETSGRFAAALDPVHVLLTPREIEVLAAIADGLGNKEIARRLDISLHTVKFHIESVFRKLGVRSRAEAVTKGWDILRGAIEL
jgi:DNA-binding NarL/FixJ family response regulator